MKNPSFEEFKGYTHRQSAINEIYSYIVEDRAQQVGYLQKYLPLSLVTAFNPETREITDISCSVPNDIITNQFGEWFAKLLANSGTESATMMDITNTPITVNTYGNNGTSAAPFNNVNTISYLTQVQVGTGGTTPLRSDFNIETPFANGGPEDSRQNSNEGSHIVANNTVQVNQIITPTAAGGTVSETCLFLQMKRSTGLASNIFMFSRDLVTITFLTGQSISVSYVWDY